MTSQLARGLPGCGYSTETGQLTLLLSGGPLSCTYAHGLTTTTGSALPATAAVGGQTGLADWSTFREPLTVPTTNLHVHTFLHKSHYTV